MITEKTAIRALEFLRSKLEDGYPNPEGLCEWLESLPGEEVVRMAIAEGWDGSPAQH